MPVNLHFYFFKLKKHRNKREVGEVTISIASYLLIFEDVNIKVIMNGILRITKVKQGENPDYICNRLIFSNTATTYVASIPRAYLELDKYGFSLFFFFIDYALIN